MSLADLVLIMGGTLTGLAAGVYYTFNVAVVPALLGAKPKAHIDVMQQINRKIQNPVFFLSFFGPTILLPAAAYLFRETAQFPLLVAAAVLHIVGGDGVTIGGNIPLNNQLDKVNVEVISEGEADRIRQEFQGKGSRWMRYHNIRTLASIAATVLVLIACLRMVAE